MKQLSNVFSRLDRFVDRYISPWWPSVRRYIPHLAITVLTIMVAVLVVRSLHNKPEFTAAMLSHDLRTIEMALHQIDASCDILSLDRDRIHVDFLTVASFHSSEVGGINLGRPENWEGPYVPDNPALQGKVYEVVTVDQGVFLTPGDGVELPNGLVMGRDVVITPETNISELLNEGGSLNYHGEQLATRLTFRIGNWGGIPQRTISVDNLGDTLAEFNKAIPYAGREG